MCGRKRGGRAGGDRTPPLAGEPGRPRPRAIIEPVSMPVPPSRSARHVPFRRVIGRCVLQVAAVSLRGRGRPGSLGVVLVAVEAVGLLAVNLFVDVVAYDLYAAIAERHVE